MRDLRDLISFYFITQSQLVDTGHEVNIKGEMPLSKNHVAGRWMLAAVRAKISTLITLQENIIFTSRIFRIIYNKNAEIYNFMFTKLPPTNLSEIQIAATLWLMKPHEWRTLTSLWSVWYWLDQRKEAGVAQSCLSQEGAASLFLLS